MINIMKPSFYQFESQTGLGLHALSIWVVLEIHYFPWIFYCVIKTFPGHMAGNSVVHQSPVTSYMFKQEYIVPFEHAPAIPHRAEYLTSEHPYRSDWGTSCDFLLEFPTLLWSESWVMGMP